jgi:PAS domain S-box-containing protein
MEDTKILIVEGKKTVAKNVEGRLKELGYTVCAVAPTGAQGVKKAAEMQPDIVFIDIGLEGEINGIEAAERLRNSLDIPTIYLTHCRNGAFLRKGKLLKQAKITDLLDYIPEPYGKRRLYLTIESVLSKRRQEKESESHKQYLTTILSGISDAVIATSNKGLIRYMNPVAETLTGWAMEEVSGKLVTDILDIYVDNAGHREKDPFLMDVLEKESFHTRESSPASGVDYNTYLIAKSGREISIDYNIAPIKDEQENSTGIVITARNITKYKTMEDQLNQTIGELRHQTQLMKTVFDSLFDGIVVLSLAGEVLFVNPSIQQVFGTDPPGPFSQWSETHGVYYPDKETRVPIDQILATRVARGEAVKDKEFFIRNKEQTDGIHVRVSAIPLFDEKVIGCVCVVRDITEDKMAAIQLEQTMQQLQNQVQLTDTIFNGISDGVIAADASGAFTIFNPSAEKILGIGPIETSPDRWSDDYGFFFPDRVTPFPADELPLARAIKGESSDEVEMFVRNPEVPEGIFISVSGRPLQAEEGTENGGVVVFRDVTHRVIAEEALTQAFAQGRLEIVETLLHNIGNAINSVTVGIDMLQKNLIGNPLMRDFFAFTDLIKAHQEDWVDYIKNDPKGKQVLPFIIALAADFTDQDREVAETLERVSERVTHINDIILTQKPSNQSGMIRKNINLQQAILSAVKLQQDSIDKRGIQVYVNCEDAPEEIRIQESQFHQMLVNLVKNSIEAIDERIQSGGLSETPCIEIKAYIHDDFVCLDVTDNGIGIAQKNFKLIFSAGYTTKESGTGLGLHSSANFVIGSGGKIYPLSEGIGKGTTMRIMLRCSSVIPP